MIVILLHDKSLVIFLCVSKSFSADSSNLIISPFSVFPFLLNNARHHFCIMLFLLIYWGF